MNTIVVPTGVANLAAVAAALHRLDAAFTVATTPADVATADAVVLPGVGHFGAAMQQLAAAGMVTVLRERLLRGRPTLGICLGMQLCAARSEEAPSVPGLGVLDAAATAFPPGVRSPQMGWNEVACEADAALLRPGMAFFANSYRLTDVPRGFCAAHAEHGGPFVAALERGAVLLCQFHPELSGRYGHGLLQRWLQRAAAEAAPC